MTGKNLQIRYGDGSPAVAITVTALQSDADPVVDDVEDWLAERFWIHDEPDAERVAVDPDVLDELIETARGDLERLVTVDGYEEGDDVVDDLVDVIEQAEDALEREQVIDA